MVDKVIAKRPDGSQQSYSWSPTNQRYENSAPDADDWFVRNANGTWTKQHKSGPVEDYSVTGFITSLKMKPISDGPLRTLPIGFNRRHIRMVCPFSLDGQETSLHRSTIQLEIYIHTLTMRMAILAL